MLWSGKKKKGVPSLLIVQKETGYIHTKRTGVFERLSQEQQLSLWDSHRRHEAAKEQLLDFCSRNNLACLLISDYELVPKCLDGHVVVVTLGGDGTFLKTASHLSDQPILGVNTDPQNSVGGLTTATKKSMIPLLRNFLNGKPKLEHWLRLTALVNGKPTKMLALNEVVVGSPHLHQTSHLKVRVDKKVGKAHGSGLLVTTNKGSTAFHKSAGAKPFTKKKIGFAFLMPHRLVNLPRFGRLSSQSRICVEPLRSGYELMFDSKIAGELKLRQGDRVEIYVAKHQPLRVLVS